MRHIELSFLALAHLITAGTIDLKDVQLTFLKESFAEANCYFPLGPR